MQSQIHEIVDKKTSNGDRCLRTYKTLEEKYGIMYFEVQVSLAIRGGYIPLKNINREYQNHDFKPNIGLT